MELWGKDAAYRGTVAPVFYSRAGEIATVARGVPECSRSDHGRCMLRRLPPLSFAAAASACHEA